MAKTSDDTQAPDPWAIMDRMTAALEALAKQPQAETSKTQDMMTALTQGLARLAEANVAGSQLIANETRRAARPSNEIYHGVSVFNRRGTLLPDGDDGPKKRPLKCEMFIPFIVEWESITREECELLNLLQQGEYKLQLVDKSQVRMAVKMQYKLDGVTPNRLLMMDIDNEGQPGTLFSDKRTAMLVPALPDWLRYLLRQHAGDIPKLAAAVMTDEEEEALIEAGALTFSK